jgi:hypothetical protein
MEGEVRSNVDMEYGLSGKPNEYSFLPTGLSPSYTFPSTSSEVCTLVHSERAPASTSDSSVSFPWEVAASQMMDMTAVISACPSCDGTGSPFLHVALLLLSCPIICS